MATGTNFEDSWRNYCWLCEWRDQCLEDKPCMFFHPPDWMDFYVAEVVDDQNMRQSVYLGVMLEIGGDA